MTPGAAGSGCRRRLLLAYDGEGFAGWQVQPDQPTVQGTLEQALAGLLGQPVRVHGAGRTDAGVHAWGQVCHFDDPRPWSEERLAGALNGCLPPSIRVREVHTVPGDFHALHGARRKTYLYQFFRSTVVGGVRGVEQSVPPLLRRTHLAVRADLDLAAMRRAARHLVGCRDFTTLSKVMPAGRSTVKTLSALRLLPTRHRLRLLATGDGFLYGMVRLAGSLLLEVGRGRVDADAVPELLDARDRALAPPSLPAHGLCLLRVDY